MIRKLILLAACLLCGCASRQPIQDAPPNVIIWAGGACGDGAQMWLTEARKRFANPLILACHGDDHKGVWTAYPDETRLEGPIEPVAQALHDAMPWRPIVLLNCNPDHQILHVPGVYYATDSVWSYPGNDWRQNPWTGEWEYGVGSIWDFREGRPSHEVE